MKAKIIAFNSRFENGKCVGGYYEIHKVSYLASKEHLVATIRSIIENNIKYGYDDTTLMNVMIECDDHNAVEYISKNSSSIFSNYLYLRAGICISALDSF